MRYQSKQTAANNEVIAAVKRLFNSKITKHFSQTLNEFGESEALTYLAQFSTKATTREGIIKSAKAVSK